VLHERLVRLMGSADAATARRARACLLQARDPGCCGGSPRAGVPGPLLWVLDPRRSLGLLTVSSWFGWPRRWPASSVCLAGSCVPLPLGEGQPADSSPRLATSRWTWHTGRLRRTRPRLTPRCGGQLRRLLHLPV